MLSKLRMVNGFIMTKYFNRTPFYATYNVTFRCNSRCVYCDYWKSDSPELNTENALKVVDRMSESGISMLAISGGEPLLRNDLNQLLKRARDLGVINTLNTSGLIIKEQLAFELAKYVDAITISIDGPPEVHDKQRGIKGAFERSVRALALYKSAGIRVGINMVLTDLNKDLVMETYNLLEDYIDFMTVQPVNPPLKNGISEKTISDLHSIKGKLFLPESYIEYMKEYINGGFNKICDALKLYYAVDPLGNVLACAARHDIIVGNLLHDSYKQIIGNISKTSMEEIDKCTGCYLVCTVGVNMQLKQSVLNSAVQVIRAYK
ncbi:MAG: radical SAM protein [Conexivisphaerales archaeon]